MKSFKKFIIPFIAVSLPLASCHNKAANANLKDAKWIEYNLNVDYGRHISNQATLLMDNIIIPFDYKKFDIDYLAAGDRVSIAYKGTWMIQESYPARLYPNEVEILDVKVIHGKITEFELLPIPGGGYDLVEIDRSNSARKVTVENCINKDSSFAPVESYPMQTRMYGIVPAALETTDIVAVYSYNPSK